MCIVYLDDAVDITSKNKRSALENSEVLNDWLSVKMHALLLTQILLGFLGKSDEKLLRLTQVNAKHSNGKSCPWTRDFENNKEKLWSL